MVVFLDTSVLGYVTHPKGNAKASQCTQWLVDLLSYGNRVCIPEVCDFELRREYVRRKAIEPLEKLDALKKTLEYIPINTLMMHRAADLWAHARNMGRPTADQNELDVDVILAAQGQYIAAGEDNLVIATSNVGHLSIFADARLFEDIPPRVS